MRDSTASSKTTEASDQDNVRVCCEEPGPSISVFQQIVSSATGAIVTSLLMTPMDVVKIRLQRQHHPFPKGQCFYYHNGLMDHLCTPCENRKPCAWYQRPGNFSGTIDAFVKITRHEGLRSLWSGLSPTFLCCRRTMTPELVCPPDWSAAMLAGTIARATAVTVVSPLEMIRTKMQSEQLSYREIGKALHVTMSARGWQGFYLGWMPTLLRDIPFSAIYWAVYDTLKKRLMKMTDLREPTFATSFLCGAIAGSFAALITTPFDVIKTHLQIRLGDELATHRVPLSVVLRDIIRKGGGITALFAGVVPRVAKIAPACAVMIGSYEYFKLYFKHLNAKKRSEERINFFTT